MGSQGQESQKRAIALGVAIALLAAAAFGATTPLIQRFGEGSGPLVTAALLYAGAALASAHALFLPSAREARLRPRQAPRLLAIALVGAGIAPACLAWGLGRTSASSASLLLNLEAVFTVLLARAVHKEAIGGRVAVALGLIGAGGALVALQGEGGGAPSVWGPLAVLAATFAWAVDNTLTRPLADFDPSQVVLAKGALGAAATALVAWLTGEPLPALGPALLLLLVGATGYGLSLRLYLVAQRRLGAARTASVFAVAPFVGVAIAFALGERTVGALTACGGMLLVLGVVLHVTEQHSHGHHHEAVEHEHAHRHDDGHHDHVHAEEVKGMHSHAHRHEPVTHVHEHAPDLHHGHRH